MSIEKYKGPLPSPSHHPPLPSLDTQKEMVKKMLREGGDGSEEVKKLVSVAKLPIHCNRSCCLAISSTIFSQTLARDDLRRIVTSMYDAQSSFNDHELDQDAITLFAVVTQSLQYFPAIT
jgi:hypothetical protein